MRERLQLSLLGDLIVSCDDRPIADFESDKARALLAFLAVERDRPQRREKLAGLLWPDLPEKRARRNLSQALYSLRKVLGETGADAVTPIFLATPHDVCFNASGNASLDVDAFRAGVQGCNQHAPRPSPACDACLERQAEAVDLYDGDLLQGFSLPDCAAFEEWLLLQRERLQRDALATLTALAAAERQRGRLLLALRHARRAVVLDPLWEPARRELMNALWCAGHRVQALQVYEACRELLQVELGVTPDELTEELARRIRADCEMVSSRSLARHNLPYALTPFIGRKRELREVMELLASPACRLLTLVGLGGSGKSRFAVEIGRRLTEVYDDGTVFVPLGSLSRTSSLAAALIQVFDLPTQEESDPWLHLADFLRGRRMLLILDGFETVIDEANLVVDLLRRAENIKVLVTSHLKLGVKGEYVYDLGGLQVPGVNDRTALAQAEAVQLFFSAAQRTLPGYQTTRDTLPAVATVCRLVEGMPLGIILASAWLRTYSEAAIAHQIEASLEFLAVEWADLPPRQRSLRATLDYTWRLLSAEEQASLAALSVFRGGFTAEASAFVADLTGSTLRALLERSIIQRTTGERFTIHDLPHHYAAERLAAKPGAETRARARHADYFTSLVACLIDDLQGEGQQEALDHLDADAANLSTAWDWALAQGQVGAMDITLEGLALYYEMRRRYEEGEKACAAATDVGTLLFRVRAQVWQARFARLLGKRQAAGRLCRQAKEQLQQPGIAEQDARLEQAFLNLELGNGAFHQDIRAASDWFYDSLEGYRFLKKRWWVARVLARLGELSLLTASGKVEYYRESLSLYRDLGDPSGTASAMIGLGNVIFRLGQTDEGINLVREGVEIQQSQGMLVNCAVSRSNLARLLFWQGKFAESTEIFEGNVPIFKEYRLMDDLIEACVGVSLDKLSLGHYELARRWADEAILLIGAGAKHLWSAVVHQILGIVDLASGKDEEAARALEKSLAICNDLHLLDWAASAHAYLASVVMKEGEQFEAYLHLRESLSNLAETRIPDSGARILPSVAYYLAEQGSVARAVEVYALICLQPFVAGSAFIHEIAGRPIYKRATAQLTRAEIAAAEARGRALDLWPTVIKLLDELA